MALVASPQQVYSNYYVRLTSILVEYANLRWSESANLNVSFEIEILPDTFYILRVKDRQTASQIYTDYRTLLCANNLEMNARRHFLYRRLVIAYGKCLDRPELIKNRLRFLVTEILRLTEAMVSEVGENCAHARVIRIQD